MPGNDSSFSEMVDAAGSAVITQGASLMLASLKHIWDTAIDPQKNIEDVLRALNDLSSQINNCFDALNRLLIDQIQLVIDAQYGVLNAQAKACALTAISMLKRCPYENQSDRPALLDQADLASGMATNLYRTSASSAAGSASQTIQVGYLGGFAMAGTIRLQFIAAVRPDPSEFITVYADEVRQLCDLLGQMIATVSTAVEASHIVVGPCTASVEYRGPKGREVEADASYYAHLQVGKDNGIVNPLYERDYYFAGHVPEDAQKTSESEAVRRARADRDRGVKAELKYLGIPQFKDLLEQWGRTISCFSCYPVPPRIWRGRWQQGC